jgi:putative mycofactocin binding protein MftB
VVVLETRQLVDVVSGLERHPDVHAAVEAAGVEEAQRPAYLRALSGLAANGIIEKRHEEGSGCETGRAFPVRP